MWYLTKERLEAFFVKWVTLYILSLGIGFCFIVSLYTTSIYLAVIVSIIPSIVIAVFHTISFYGAIFWVDMFPKSIMVSFFGNASSLLLVHYLIDTLDT